MYKDSVPDGYHTPVLLERVLECLVTTPDGVYVDGTIGGGGHAEQILTSLSPKGKLVGFDSDADAIEYVGTRLHQYKSQVLLIHENFVHMRSSLQTQGIEAVDGVLLDLGVSSFQLETPGKGFSFQRDERLDMRMDTRQRIDAAHIVRTMNERELERILAEYGEERFARKIARTIVHQRKTQPIGTTGSLRVLVENVVGRGYLQKSLARVFQALRIAVNDELQNLQAVLHDIVELVKVGGRIVVISYHSLEDRVVKDFFKLESTGRNLSIPFVVPLSDQRPRLRIMTKKPLVPSQAEITMNRRARSAKLRAAERI